MPCLIRAQVQMYFTWDTVSTITSLCNYDGNMKGLDSAHKSQLQLVKPFSAAE